MRREIRLAAAKVFMVTFDVVLFSKLKMFLRMVVMGLNRDFGEELKLDVMMEILNMRTCPPYILILGLS